MEKMDPPSFICDEMLKKLARWLRIMGYDVIDPVVAKDSEMVQISEITHRTVLTRDKDLSNSKHIDALRILSDELDLQIIEVLDRYPLSRYRPGRTRCPICNGDLLSRPTADIHRCWNPQTPIPQDIIKEHPLVYECGGCGKVYWTGSHWNSIVCRLSAFGMEPELPD
jgi:uncharacterized protein with PIN domain